MSQIPLDQPLIASFSYLNDCKVKLAVYIKQKNNSFFMKNPVKPDPSWRMNVIIRSVSFPANHPIKFLQNPNQENEYWESEIIKKVAQSDHAEVYEIKEPHYFSVLSLRKSARIFCLAPIYCMVENQKHKATCIDISEDGSGLGIRFDTPVSIPPQTICQIRFAEPLQDLPEIQAKIVRQSVSSMDRSISAGLVTLPEFKEQAKQVIQIVINAQIAQNQEMLHQNFTDTPSLPGFS
jgi:hypothetical protein